MNKKMVSKLISIILILVFALLLFSPYSHAEDSDWISQGSSFIKRGEKNQSGTISTTNIKNALMPIGRILVTIATIVLTVVTVVMAIKYMMSKDDANERAKLKTQLIGLVVSTIVIYGAQVIWSLLYDFMTKVTS